LLNASLGGGYISPPGALRKRRKGDPPAFPGKRGATQNRFKQGSRENHLAPRGGVEQKEETPACSKIEKATQNTKAFREGLRTSSNVDRSPSLKGEKVVKVLRRGRSLYNGPIFTKNSADNTDGLPSQVGRAGAAGLMRIEQIWERKKGKGIKRWGQT